MKVREMNKGELKTKKKQLEEQAKINKRDKDWVVNDFENQKRNFNKHIGNLEFSLSMIVRELTEKNKREEEQRFEEEKARYENE